MDFAYGPMEPDNDPYGLKPLDLDDEDDEEFEDDDSDIFFIDPYEDGDDDEDEEEEEFIDPRFGGYDDLKPFGSFDDGFGWDEGFL